MVTEDALFFLGSRKVEIRRVEAREPRDGELVARALASGVSQGTELLLYRGEGPEPFDPSLGTMTYPCRYGYAWVGETASGGRVFALAPHGTRHCLARERFRELPSTIPPKRAVLAANLETALTCAWDAETVFGDRVLVLGAGVVGVLTAWILARSGCRVTVVEPLDGRRAVARALLGPGSNIVGARESTADVVVEATGMPSALDDAIGACVVGGRVVVASFYGKRRAPVDLGDAFHRRRLTLVASQVSSLPTRLTQRFDRARRFGIVVELLTESILDVLLAVPVAFDRAPELYAALDRNADGPPCSVFVYP